MATTRTRGYHNQRVSLLIESVTHPERVQKSADLQQAYYRWESNLKEFQRGGPTGLDDDVKANAVRHMMPKGDFGRSEFAAAIPHFR